VLDSKAPPLGLEPAGKYCKNKFCTLCCAIRKAKIINMIKVIAGFKLILSKHRKKNQRGKGIRLIGIKSLECNFHPAKATYNPHLHLIVQSEAIADILIEEWLTNWKRYTSYKAQYKRRVEDRERDLIEIVKYGSKIFTEPDVNKKANSKGESHIYTAALDNIFKMNVDVDVERE